MSDPQVRSIAAAPLAPPSGEVPGEAALAATPLVVAQIDARASAPPPTTIVPVRRPLAAGLARPRAVQQLTCDSASCRNLRAEMHRFLDGADINVPKGAAPEVRRAQRAAELEAAGIDPEWARRFVDRPNIEEADLRWQLECWKAAVAEQQRRAAEAQSDIPPVSGPSATGIFDRSRIATQGSISEREANAIRADLRKLDYAAAASGAWDADLFEAYKDFVERAVRSRRLSPEQAASAQATDRTVVRALLRNAALAPEADLRASPAQAGIKTKVAPEFEMVRQRRRTVRQPTGHHNRPEDVERVQRALMARGFFIDERTLGTYDDATQNTVQLYNAAYRGLHEREGGTKALTPGSPMTRSLFGTPDETPHLVDGPRWGELQGDPSIGLRIYATPGSYTTSWGTQRARQFVIDLAKSLHDQDPTWEILANDISKKDGGPHPFHSGHQVGMECDITHPDRPEDSAGERAWFEARKTELRAMGHMGDRIAFIYSSNSELLGYGRTLGLNMIEVGGHRGHFHVGLKAWT